MDDYAVRLRFYPFVPGLGARVSEETCICIGDRHQPAGARWEADLPEPVEIPSQGVLLYETKDPQARSEVAYCLPLVRSRKMDALLGETLVPAGCRAERTEAALDDTYPPEGRALPLLVQVRGQVLTLSLGRQKPEDRRRDPETGYYSVFHLRGLSAV